MKKILLFSVFFLLFLLAAQEPCNLVLNPSFEKSENGSPAFWSKIRRGTFENVHFTETSRAFDGNCAAGISFSDRSAGKTMLIWGQTISEKAFKAIPAGTPMVFSVYAQALDTPAQGKIYFESVRAGRTIVTRKKLQPGVWTQLVVKFTKENIAYPSANVYLQLEGRGKIIFDKVFFGSEKDSNLPVPVQMNLAANGDMELSNKKGTPADWYQITHFKGGRLFSDRNTVYSGKVSLGMESETSPGKKLMGWGYLMDGKILKDVPPGSPMNVQFQLKTHGNPSTQVRCYVEFMSNRRYIGTTGKNFSVYNNWEQKTLFFKTPQEKPTHFWIYFMLKTPGKAHIDAVELKTGSPEEKRKTSAAENKDYCRLLAAPPQRTWFLPSKPEKLTVEYSLSSPGLEVSLNEIDGVHIKKWNFAGLSGKGQKELSLPALKKGAYVITATFFMSCSLSFPGIS